MERFIRDFGFLVSLLVLPVGLYFLNAGVQDRKSATSAALHVGAVLTASGLVGIACSIRAHFSMREHLRHIRGKRERLRERPVRP